MSCSSLEVVAGTPDGNQQSGDSPFLAMVFLLFIARSFFRQSGRDAFRPSCHLFGFNACFLP